MRIPTKIKFFLFCLFAPLAATAFNMLFLIGDESIAGTVGLLGAGLAGTVFSRLILQWQGPRIVRAGLIAMPALVTALSAAALNVTCGMTHQQPVCAQNPLLLSIVPMSIAYIMVGGEYFGKFLVWASLKYQARFRDVER